MYYTIVKRNNPQDKKAAKKFYAKPVWLQEVTESEFANEISEAASVNSADVVAVIRAFVRLLPKWLKKGNRVRLGDFGLIKLSFSATGQETKEAVTTADIKKVRIALVPGSSLKALVQDVTFEHFEVQDVADDESSEDEDSTEESSESES